MYLPDERPEPTRLALVHILLMVAVAEHQAQTRSAMGGGLVGTSPFTPQSTSQAGRQSNKTPAEVNVSEHESVSHISVQNSADELEEYKRKYEDLKAKLEVAKASPMVSNQAYAREVNDILAKKVFHTVKFVLDDDLLLEIDDEKSIGGIVLHELQIAHEDKAQFWNTYRHLVSGALSQQRSNNCGYLKNEYLGL